jgi:hypothetical protein
LIRCSRCPAVRLDRRSPEYLWGPGGRRLVDHRSRAQTGAMTYCTLFPGNYHLQGKVAGGGGSYKLGVYTR